MKEVIKYGVKYLHIDSSHLCERRSENHFKVLLGYLFENLILEQEAAPVHTLNAMKNMSSFMYLSKGTNSSLESELFANCSF